MTMKFLTRIAARVLLALGLVMFVLPAQSVRSAGPINVACGNTAGLIQAVVQAQNETTNPGLDTIILAAGCTTPYTFHVPYDPNSSPYLNVFPKIYTPIHIIGNGAVLERSTHPSTPDLRLFEVEFEGDLQVDGITARNWKSSYGSVIVNYGTAQIFNSTFYGNQANNYGGAIANRDFMMLVNVTLTENKASATSGAIDNWQPDEAKYRGKLYIINSTIARNTGTFGAGIYNDGLAYVYLYNTIIESNIGGNCHNRSAGVISDVGGNVQWGDSTCGANMPTSNPRLVALTNNGGLTPTMAIDSGSAALEVGLPDYCPDIDQRGFPRPQPAGSRCDSGAYESSVSRYFSTQLSFNPSGVVVGQSSQLTFRLSNLYHELLRNAKTTIKLPDGMTVSGNAKRPACLLKVEAPLGGDSIRVEFNNLNPSADCTFSIPVAANSAGGYTASEVVVETDLTGPYTIDVTSTQLSVTQALAQVMLSSDRSETQPGKAAQLLAFVQPEYPGSATPTGTVAFYAVTVPGMSLAGQNPVNVVTLDEAGEAVFSVSPAQVGAHHYMAVYSGDSNYTPATSQVLDLLVSLFTISLPLVVSP